nr:hypothetical protein P5631_08910 [Bacillus subtilis]
MKINRAPPAIKANSQRRMKKKLLLTPYRETAVIMLELYTITKPNPHNKTIANISE